MTIRVVPKILVDLGWLLLRTLSRYYIFTPQGNGGPSSVICKSVNHPKRRRKEPTRCKPGDGLSASPVDVNTNVGRFQWGSNTRQPSKYLCPTGYLSVQRGVSPLHLKRNIYLSSTNNVSKCTLAYRQSPPSDEVRGDWVGSRLVTLRLNTRCTLERQNYSVFGLSVESEERSLGQGD